MIYFRSNKPKLYPYNRIFAYNYAKKWAYSRNPNYYNFNNIGGDCTNFVSQVLYAGGCPMNYYGWRGWYYINLSNRSPSWTSVEHLYKFIINNTRRGPVGRCCNISDLKIGDIVQLNFEKNDKVFNHSLVVVNIKLPRSIENIYISTHTMDRFNYKLSKYTYNNIRFIHILGYRK